jgi:pyruvate ferredoxin oxidoreductase alpha subunit
MLDGNGAAVEGIRLLKPGVIAAYPITPQSSIAERLSVLVANGTMKSQYVRVESEHSAMSVCIGAQLTGVRAATATSSVGLALMHEVCGMPSGCRLPLVMPVVNRSLASPWSLWCDHSDTMAERDTGWLQFYAGTVQEVLDLILAACRISESSSVLTPSMVCLDGFFLSHSMQKVFLPEDDEATEFVGEYVRQNMYLDTADPMFVCNLTPSDSNGEMRYQQKVGFDEAARVAPQVFKEFTEKFGRKLSVLDPFMMDDAEVAVVTIGSMGGTAKYVVKQLREKGIRAGALRIVMFRPFPEDEIRQALKHVKVVGVVDRSSGLGSRTAPVCTEVKAALYQTDVNVQSFIGGIAGRDISNHSFERIFGDLLAVKDGTKTEVRQWFDVCDDPMSVREVEL